ncbi:hypothetical protein ARMGADRAFT_1089808 [Armillaria gallica]|uniref:Chromo domain-containing protein n=1 Tax=Armillaria gallica TaxID=47427 RepID=A0A2H3D213_ARMGA|nr:hypothetical protein ARMGADRAFT_1089808 [Armillaria gallica]
MVETACLENHIFQELLIYAALYKARWLHRYKLTPFKIMVKTVTYTCTDAERGEHEVVDRQWRVDSVELPAFLNQEQPPPLLPDLIDNNEEYEIEEVLNSHPCTIQGKRGQKSQKVIDYFVKWKGWMREHNSWVRDEEMGNAQEAIEEYEDKVSHARRVDAPTKIITKDENKYVALIIDFKYKDSSCFYLPNDSTVRRNGQRTQNQTNGAT